MKLLQTTLKKKKIGHSILFKDGVLVPPVLNAR